MMCIQGIEYYPNWLDHSMCDRIKADEAGCVETFKKVERAVPVILSKPGSPLLRSLGLHSPVWEPGWSS